MGLQDLLFPDLRIIKNQLAQLTMNLTEAFAQLAASDTELKKALGEVRTNTDTLIQQVASLKDALANVTLTPEQQAIVDSISATAQQLDDIVPDAPTA